MMKLWKSCWSYSGDWPTLRGDEAEVGHEDDTPKMSSIGMVIPKEVEGLVSDPLGEPEVAAWPAAMFP
jgi:hypothetical protein